MRITESILHKIIKESVKRVLMESIYDTPTDINGKPINVGDVIIVTNFTKYQQFQGVVKNIKMETGWYEYSTEPIFEIVVDLLRRRTNEVYDTITITSNDNIEVKGTFSQLKRQQQQQRQGHLNKNRLVAESNMDENEYFE